MPDLVASRLREKERELHGELSTRYEGYSDEWPTLRQSVLYGHLALCAILQITECDLFEDLDDNLCDSLLQLQQVFANLVSDQLERASVLITAAEHSHQGAVKIKHGVAAERKGLHPSLLRLFKDLGPPPKATKQPAESKSYKGKSTGKPWLPSANGARSKPSGNHKPTESFGPTKGTSDK